MCELGHLQVVEDRLVKLLHSNKIRDTYSEVSCAPHINAYQIATGPSSVCLM